MANLNERSGDDRFYGEKFVNVEINLGRDGNASSVWSGLKCVRGVHPYILDDSGVIKCSVVGSAIEAFRSALLAAGIPEEAVMQCSDITVLPERKPQPDPRSYFSGSVYAETDLD